MDPDQRERSARICQAINHYLSSQGIDPDSIISFGEFVRSDDWEGYLHLNSQDDEQYPLFEIDDRGFCASDIDFIHAYCMDGNRLSSFINSVDRDTVTADCLLGQVFFYGMPSLATWFNRHDPRIAQVKAFDLLVANLLEAEATIASHFIHKDDNPLASPLITPRRSAVELHLQSLRLGVYGQFGPRKQPVFNSEVLNALFGPVGSEQVESYRKALAVAKKQILSEGSNCEESRVETAQNLLVGTILNPGFFLLIAGERLEVIQESTRLKAAAWALECGFDPVFAQESIEFMLLSIDPQLLHRAQLHTRHWYRPNGLGVPQLEGALTGMAGFESAPFTATYKFFSKHYGDELTAPIVSMLEADHPYFKNVLADDRGYHPVVDQMLQDRQMTMAAIRSVGSQMLVYEESIRRYNPAGLSYIAAQIYQTPEGDRYSNDARLLQFIVRGCPDARAMILEKLDCKPVITLDDLTENGLCPADSPALMKKFRLEDADELFARELGL